MKSSLLETKVQYKKKLKFMRRKKVPRTKKNGGAVPQSLTKLKKLLDTKFSLWTRLSAADGNGICECYTCGHKAHYKKMHAGHYISRYYLYTRWLESNVKVQCPMCNLWKRGDPVMFRQKLVKELGEADVRFMEETSRKLFKPTREFYEKEIKTYTDRLAKLQEKV